MHVVLSWASSALIFSESPSSLPRGITCVEITDLLGHPLDAEVGVVIVCAPEDG